MLFRWSLLALGRRAKPDFVIVGTDPILSVLVAIAWRFFQPKTVIAHWCFDLYPEAAFADGLLDRQGAAARVLDVLLKKAYRACDLVVDIGPCMRALLLRYDGSLPVATIVPWALDEPRDVLPVPAVEREFVFGNAPAGLLYAGSFGRAHSYESLLSLARLLRPSGVRLAFSVRGNREAALRAAVQPEDSNVSFVPFAAAERLADRLACADVHVVSLREEWTGTVVPSKSFGALAVGRPLLFCGDRGSAIAHWIEQYDLGWVLTEENARAVAASMVSLMNDPAAKARLNQRCQRIYQEHFSREVALDEWHRLLTGKLESRSRD
jgi:glycosyltransferase involved in cell wall biosynthesis